MPGNESISVLMNSSSDFEMDDTTKDSTYLLPRLLTSVLASHLCAGQRCPGIELIHCHYPNRKDFLSALAVRGDMAENCPTAPPQEWFLTAVMGSCFE